ncbi:hypothetical protein, partial [Rhodoferax sp.]|uniref:hypothetical protein n=1 Tax=Rhodoferax sp. TaxID=50421 RepID=UPI003BB7D708
HQDFEAIQGFTRKNPLDGLNYFLTQLSRQANRPQFPGRFRLGLRPPKEKCPCWALKKATRMRCHIRVAFMV